MSSDISEKARAVFLALVMVTSVMAAGMALTGSAAAQDAEVSGGGDALQTAIDNATEDDVIEVTDDSSYNQIIIDRDEHASNLTIRAADDASPTIAYSGNNGEPAVAIDQDDITLEGFTIDRSGSSSLTAQAVRVAGNNIQLTDNTYKLDGSTNDAAVAVLTDSSGAAGNPDTSGVTISDVTISGGEIITNDASQTGVLVADDGAASFGGGGSVSVSDVTFTANAGSTQMLELDTGGGIVNIADTFEDNDFSEAAALDETASDASVDGFDLSIDGLISTSIQDAVDVAATGSTIEVASGNYDEHIDLGTDDVTLRGPNSDTPGDELETRTTEATVNGRISLTGNGTTVTGLKVTDPVDLNHVYTQAITIEGGADDVTVANNIVRDITINETAANQLSFTQGIEGIAAFGIKNDAVEDPTIRNNFVTNVSSINNGNIAGSAGIMVQGNVDGATVNENNATEIGGEGTPWAHGVVVTGTGNHDIPPQNVSVSNNEISRITSDEREYFGVGIGLEATDGDVTFSSNTLAENELHFEDKTDTVSPDVFINSNPVDRGTLVANGTTSEFRGVITGKIQPAFSYAEPSDTISVEDGIYNESVEIATQNVTVEGPNAGTPGDESRNDEAIIQQGVKINASEVTLDGLQVETNGTNGVRIGPEVVPDDVTIQNNVITNVGGGDFLRDNTPTGAGNGIQIQFNNGEPEGETVDNLRILDNEIANVSTLDEEGGTTAIGINILPRGNDVDVEIRRNTIREIEPGSSANDEAQARGISIDTQDDAKDGSGRVDGVVIENNTITNLSADDDIWAISLFEDGDLDPKEGVKNFTIRENTIDNLDADVEEVALFIGGYADLGAQHEVRFNDFNDGAVARITSEGEGFDSLNATLNWWGEDSTPRVVGNTLYDPVLTVSADELESTNAGEVRDYGSYLELSSDGSAVAIGFSAPPEEDAEAILSDVVDVPSRVYRYDNDNEGFVSVDGSYEPSTGEVLVIATADQGIDNETIVPIDTDFSEAETPSSVEVNQGWNLVATGATNNANGIEVADGGADGVITSESLQVQPAQPGAPDAEVGAFEGTWLFVDADGQLFTGYAEGQSPSEYSSEVLEPDEDKSN